MQSRRQRTPLRNDIRRPVLASSVADNYSLMLKFLSARLKRCNLSGFPEYALNAGFIGPIGNERYREYIKDLHAAAASGVHGR